MRCWTRRARRSPCLDGSGQFLDEVIDRKVGTRHNPRGVRVAWTASRARRCAQAKEAVCQKEMRILTSLLHVLVEFDCGAGLSNKHGQALL